jgi:hypothetical protein
MVALASLEPRDAGTDVLELAIEFAEQDEPMHGLMFDREECTSTYNCDPDTGWCEHTAVSVY